LLLLVDIGNTNVKFGIDINGELKNRWRVHTDRSSMPDEWWIVLTTLAVADGVELTSIDGAVVSSSVPSVTPWITTMIQSRIGVEPVVVGPTTDLGITVDVDNPTEVGPDRLVDVAAAYEKFGGPVVVLDFGTATTLNIVNHDGAFIGGAIAPDLRSAHDALVGKAAKLTSVDLVFPPSVIGRNTVAAMQAGIMLGYVGLVNGLIAQIDEELGEQPIVVSTGGFGEVFMERCPRISTYAPDLTIDGLRLVWRRHLMTAASSTTVR
jgi:type III pantothenate kinase